MSVSITEKILSTNLRALRDLHEYTLKNVGDALGIGASTVSRYERAGPQFTFPQPATLDKLAEIYQVSIADLFTSDAARERKAEVKGATLEDALFIVNKHFKSGLKLVRGKEGKAVKVAGLKKRVRARALKKKRDEAGGQPPIDTPKSHKRSRLSFKDIVKDAGDPS